MRVERIQRVPVEIQIRCEKYFKWSVFLNDDVPSLNSGGSGVIQVFRKNTVSVDRQ